jgi:hypothetical protein
MSKYGYTDDEKEINQVLNYQSEELTHLKKQFSEPIDDTIAESEELLVRLGYKLANHCNNDSSMNKHEIIIPTWEQLCAEAKLVVDSNCALESLFSEEELKANEYAIKQLNSEYSALNHMDKYDIGICVTAGLLGAAIDILLVGIPQKTKTGLSGGPLSNYIRAQFDREFPPEEMEKLANSKISKVSYDAQDNRSTVKNVEGLSAYYHRLLSLGHDPILGFIFGVVDILTGQMTTIDKSGKVVRQVIENYSDRKESNIFAAIAKQIIHLKSDVTTSMGLPVPLMGLFNFLQIGEIGVEEQTIAEIVQGMYFEGYDFIHFCSMSVSTMVIEVIIRLGYAIKRMKEGYSIKQSIPFSLNREEHPKLATMLFIGHSAATAVNAGKILFTKNPMAINYPQWLAFAKYSYMQLKWEIVENPSAKDAYVSGKINEELQEVYDDTNMLFDEMTTGRGVMIVE